MKLFNTMLALAVLSAALLPNVSQAATLYAPTGDQAVGGEVLFCRCANVTSTWKTVEFEILSGNGTLLRSEAYGIGPWGSAQVGHVGENAALCRFKVDGPKNSVRCLAVAEQPLSTGPDAVVPAQ